MIDKSSCYIIKNNRVILCKGGIPIYLFDLYERLPGRVLSKRISKEEVRAPKYTMFLLKETQLDANIFYILDSASAVAVLPGCTASGGATVFCAGEIPSTLSFQASINFIAVDCGLLELHNSMGAYLAMERSNSNIDMEGLRQKFAQIIEDRMLEDAQIESICRLFPNTIKSSYCIIYIETPKLHDKTGKDQLMRNELEELFEEDNITMYDSNLVVIHSYDGFTHPPKLPIEEFSALLRKYDAFAGISNGIRKPLSMKHQFILAKRALESGRSMDKSGKNLFFYDDTMFYSIIAFAASAFQYQVNSDDIILLGNPVLINLIKHDPNNKRNLMETLYQYIINGKSISKTAETLHMHRNTVQNRISMIEEIIGDGFIKDGLFQSKILFTYYLMQYYKNVLHKEVMYSPLCENMEKVVKIPQE